MFFQCGIRHHWHKRQHVRMCLQGFWALSCCVQYKNRGRCLSEGLQRERGAVDASCRPGGPLPEATRQVADVDAMEIEGRAPAGSFGIHPFYIPLGECSCQLSNPAPPWETLNLESGPETPPSFSFFFSSSFSPFSPFPPFSFFFLFFPFIPFFSVPGPQASGDMEFELSAPTTARNAMRLLRALQLRKPGRDGGWRRRRRV